MTDADPLLEVFHDGDCPICRIEVTFYGCLDRAGRVKWTDIVGLMDCELPAGKTRCDLLGKFHVRDLPAQPRSDHWHVGVDAFSAIWRQLPGFRWFAWIFRAPGIRQLAQLAYLGFLRWQAHNRRRTGSTASFRDGLRQL